MSLATPGAALKRLPFCPVYRFIFAAFSLGLVIALHHASAKQSSADLLVHEWGTFTCIAGSDGRPVDWLPLSGPSDLPHFVERLANTDFKGGLRGTIRMETPVLYFYSPRETTISVHATFDKGLITEWYPHASVPALRPRSDLSLQRKRTEGKIRWENVHVQPGGSADFRSEALASRYYAARETSAVPLAVDTASGPQHERFLFYRGVSAVLPPLTATISANTAVLLQNHFPETVPNAILFEHRGERVGYRVLGPMQEQATLNFPHSTARWIPWLAISKACSSHKGSSPTKLTPCCRPGKIHGSKKVLASSIWCHAPSSIPCFHSLSLLHRDNSHAYLWAGSS